ncbi:hypothetical protein [Halorussus litoreus]|uniref:hypothetical protein n=1 Tax=Halorussus litoreus TaxID=1710536 RepID=UPI001300867B|nr:hypothetical protein [Halorussus litoreus]
MPQMESDESNTKRITIRAPKSLVEDYDDVLDDHDTDRSKDIRQHMRRTVNKPQTDGGRQPPTDDEALAKGYEALRKATAGSSLPMREAKSIIASQTNIPKGNVSRRVLKPLRERGYLSRQGDPIQDPWIEVR